MVLITLVDGDDRHTIDFDPEDGGELLQLQIFSLTDVPVDEQSVTGLGTGELSATTNLSGVAPGTWALLSRKRRPASEPPVPATQPTAAQPPDAAAVAMMDMERTILSGFDTAARQADPERQRAAREVIPWDQLCARAATASGADAARPEAELRLRELLRWFKHELFSWCDRPKCELTGEATEPIGMGEPTADERAGGAARVELYRGPTGHVTRFPRYNDPAVLLRTRVGRCGEWANCFVLCARSVGFETRWVLDLTDHVWAEVWLGERWVHADPCEEALDTPLLYEQGWGKKLSYVFSFGTHEAVDVSRRYSADWAETVKRREKVKEGWLEVTIASLCAARQAELPASEAARLAERALSERAALDGAPEGAKSSRSEGLRGRQTGSVEWRRARGELGAETAPGASRAAPGEDGPGGSASGASENS